MLVTVVALIATSILIFTLVLHVIMRGLWIGALGLRYVSGDIDFKTLKYKKPFDPYLRRRIGSFDKYIAKLEDVCSILFALSFLLVFYIISFFTVIAVLTGISYLCFVNIKDQTVYHIVIGALLILIIVFGVLLTLIDFITQGFLKRNRFLARLYFPFYWVFSFLTLSFLYRPIVYNFLDNKFGKRILFTLFPIYLIVIFAISYTYRRSNYFSDYQDSSQYYANTNNYEDALTAEDVFIEDAAIPSIIITTNYLKVFVEFNDRLEDAIFDFNEGLKPSEDLRGLKSDYFYNQKSNIEIDSLAQEYMQTLSAIHSIKIDSLSFEQPEFVFTQNKNNQDGFITVIPIEALEHGKHLLRLYRLEKIGQKLDSTTMRSKSAKNMKTMVDTVNFSSIPFWYYKQDTK